MPTRAHAAASDQRHGLDAMGVLTVVLTLVGWSIVPLFIRYFAESIDPWTSNGWRYGFAALLWAPVPIIGLLRRRLPAGIWRLALVPGVLNAAGQVCFTVAHYKIDPGLLTFGLRTQILFVALGAFLMFPSERRVIRSAGFVIGTVLVIVGTIGTVALGREPFEGGHAAGVILAISAGLLFAAYALSVRRFMHGVHPITAFAVISLYAAAAMIVLMLLFGERAGLTALDPQVLTRAEFGLLLLSAVVGIALGHVFYYIAIARLGVAVSSGVIQLQPFGVALGSYIMFREVLTAPQWASGSLAVAGAVLMLLAQHRVNRASRRTSESLRPPRASSTASLRPPSAPPPPASASATGESPG
jgi:drug/metabolite transporter (DMT)-like permease